MNNDADSRELERTAWHEAGHALVGELLFGNVAQITIEPDDDTLGRQVTRGAWWTPANLRKLNDPEIAQAIARNAVRHLLAGQAAESVRYGRHRLRPEKEIFDAVEYVSVWLPGVEPSNPNELPFSFWLAYHAEWPRVRRWLSRHRAHLEAVATALLARRTLREDEWQAVLATLPDVQRPRWMVAPGGKRGR